LEESEKNYADIHKAWTDASGYYSKIEQEVQMAHEKYLEEKDWFDTSLKESKETIQKLEESLETSISDADRLTRIVSNYEKELFKLKKDGSKVSALEKKVEELQRSLVEAREEGKERLEMCTKMEDEANKMIAQAEEALGNIIREKEALQLREEEVAAERRACEDLAKELKNVPAVPKQSIAKKTQKDDESQPKRVSRRRAATNKEETVSVEEKIKVVPAVATKDTRKKAVTVEEKKQKKEKKIATSSKANAAKKDAGVKQKRTVTKKAPAVQKTTVTKKKKEEVAPPVSESTSTRTRSGRTVKRKTFADE